MSRAPDPAPPGDHEPAITPAAGEWSFSATPDPKAARLAELAKRHPTNPFATEAFAHAQHSLGRRCLLLEVAASDHTIGCLAFTHGRAWLSRRLWIPSLPALPAAAREAFGQGVQQLASDLAVAHLEADTFASPAGSTLAAIGLASRRARVEHVVSLDPQRELDLAHSHRRHVAKAAKQGLRLVRSANPDDVIHLLAATRSSMTRRSLRGESVPEGSEGGVARALLAAGAAELVMVLEGQAPRSVMLALRAAEGAYYHSAGTFPEGMRQGASPFLIAELSAQLAPEGVSTFNLGGASEDAEGLYRFKRGFGGELVSTEAASWMRGPAWLQHLLAGARTVRNAVRRPG